MNQSRRIGIFMKVLRNEDTLHQAIQSVLAQTYNNFRFYILVGEATKEIVSEYAKVDKRIEVVECKANEGISKYARIIINDNNEYLTTIDGDDWYAENYLETLLFTLQETNSDISVCSFEFVYPDGHRVEAGPSNEISFGISETGKWIPQVYQLFRTIWGVMFSKKVIENMNLSRFPHVDEYGGYGGDTLYMFNALYEADRVCICPDVLYFYRVGVTGTSRQFAKGRLDSDGILFNFVCNFLREKSELTEMTERFLYHVYGNAVIDTTRLIMTQKEKNEKEKLEQLRYIYQKEESRELFHRENVNTLIFPGIDAVKRYSNDLLYCVLSLFDDAGDEERLSCCYEIFELLFEKWKGVLSKKEFSVAILNPSVIVYLVNEEYEKAFGHLLVLLTNDNNADVNAIVHLLKRISKNNLVNRLLDVSGFVQTHAFLVYKIYQEKQDEAIAYCREQFLNENYPQYSAEILETWINIAAMLENVSEFVLAKEIKTKFLLDIQALEEAKEEYKELVEMGIVDEYTAYFSKCLD